MKSLADPLRLPCGQVLANRIAKAAMTEGLADPLNRATSAHVHLYRRWAEGGAGLVLTGNVQVDRRYLEQPGNLAIEPGIASDTVDRLRRLAASAAGTDARIWMQLSHAGRQTPVTVCREPIAPSAVPLALPGKLFAPPRAMTEGEILDVVDRFAHAARIARDAGFSGVQIHAAHGYLISQFLSPLSNRRTDDWGGSLEGRSRLLRQTIAAVRVAVGPDYPVAVKLNSADFQRGGFDHDDALDVIAMLGAGGVDLVELSGGTYEQPSMFGAPSEVAPLPASTLLREAYFTDFATRARSVATMPVMVTGGFRTRSGMEAALREQAADVIGLARPLIVEPELPRRLLAGEATVPALERSLSLLPGKLGGPRSPIRLVRSLNVLGQRSWFALELRDLALGTRRTKRRLLAAVRVKARLERATANALQRSSPA